MHHQEFMTTRICLKFRIKTKILNKNMNKKKNKKKKIMNINNKIDCHKLIAQVITLDNLNSIKKSFYETIIEYLKEDIFSICTRF